MYGALLKKSDLRGSKIMKNQGIVGKPKTLLGTLRN